MGRLTWATPFRGLSPIVTAVVFAALATDLQAQQRAPRWIDQLTVAADQLDDLISRSVRPQSRLRQQADRLLRRVDEAAGARQAPGGRELGAIRDAAVVLKSDLLDSAAQVHPERLRRIEQLLGHTEQIAGHAAAAQHAEEQSLEQVAEQLAASAAATAEDLYLAIDELQEDSSGDSEADIQRIAERSRSLRDHVKSLREGESENTSEVAVSAANLAMTLRGDLLVLAFVDSDFPLADLQAVRRAILHLEGELVDYAVIAAHQEGGNAPASLQRAAQIVGVLLEDLTTLRDAAPDQDRDLVQAMVAGAREIQTDLRNVSRNPEYAPRQRLEDVYGRITRVIEQTDSYQQQVNDRVEGLLHIVQADLVALRELTLLAASEELGLHDTSVNHILPQLTNVDLSAEEQLAVELSVQDGGVTVDRVGPRGPGARAGLRRGDVLLMANDRAIQTDVDLALELEAAARDQQTMRIVVRRDGEELTRELSLSSTPRHAVSSRGDYGNR